MKIKNAVGDTFAELYEITMKRIGEDGEETMTAYVVAFSLREALDLLEVPADPRTREPFHVVCIKWHTGSMVTLSPRVVRDSGGVGVLGNEGAT